MREIIYNKSNLVDEDISRIIKRAKLVLENNDGNILLCSSNDNYFLPGGRCEDNEDFIDCLVREVLEETGIVLPSFDSDAFLTINHIWNDIDNNVNIKLIANYYSFKHDCYFNLDNTNLTEEEIDGGFSLCYVHKNNVLDFLNNKIKTCTNSLVISDTIEAINSYLELT